MNLNQLVLGCLLAVSVACVPEARADWSWPSWLGGKSPTTTKANRTSSKAVRPSSASKTSSKSLFTNPFKKKPQTQTVSRWPSEKQSQERKSRGEEKKSWFRSWFGPEEPERLRTVDDWMKLDQSMP